MALGIIGAGLSRTGTFSLKGALEQLGVGRCYHMHELFSRRDHLPLWERAASGAPADWEQLFDGFTAACDAPACLFWRELSAFYPEAKVILTVRDPAEWYESMRSTVVEMMQRPSLLPDVGAQAVLHTARRLVLEGFFGDQFDDAAAAIARFDAHAAAVKEAIPSDRLLIYDVAQGWPPLCRFLGLPVPNDPFPQTNDRAAFRERAGLAR